MWCDIIYDQLNKSCNGALSAALAAYRKYLAFVDKNPLWAALRRYIRRNGSVTDMQSTLDKIRAYRNCVAHVKFFRISSV